MILLPLYIALVVLCGIFLVAIGSLLRLSWPDKWRRPANPEKIGPIAAVVVQSLRESPDEWTDDAYTMRHATGLSLWIANGAFGMGVVPKGEARPNAGNLNAADRQAIWYEVQQAQASRLRRSVLVQLARDGTRNNVVSLKGFGE